jgi:hypothetical protein
MLLCWLTFSTQKWSGNELFKIFNLFAFIRVNLRPFLLSCLLLNLSAFSVQAAGPVLKSMEPRGGQQGKAFTLNLVGEQ